MKNVVEAVGHGLLVGAVLGMGTGVFLFPMIAPSVVPASIIVSVLGGVTGTLMTAAFDIPFRLPAYSVNGKRLPRELDGAAKEGRLRAQAKVEPSGIGRLLRRFAPLTNSRNTPSPTMKK